MSAEFHPVVAQALERLVPRVESDPDAILARARKTRVRVSVLRVAAVAFAALALLTGGALAATKLDLLPWFQSNDRGNASFSVDSTRTYTGPVPAVLVCPRAGAGSFTCTTGALPPRGLRTYVQVERVESHVQISRSSLLAQVAAVESRGQISRAEADRLRHDVGAVGDDFFAALRELNVETIGGAELVPGRGGYELVPPAGVPLWTQCAQTADALRCHDLAGSHDVPVGTPIYRLTTSPEWIAVPRKTSMPVDVARLFHAILGRDLTPPESRLLFDLAVVSATESGPTSIATGTVATVSP